VTLGDFAEGRTSSLLCPQPPAVCFGKIASSYCAANGGNPLLELPDGIFNGFQIYRGLKTGTIRTLIQDGKDGEAPGIAHTLCEVSILRAKEPPVATAACTFNS